MFQLELLIVIALAVGATFFVFVVGIGLIINKWVELRQSKGKERLYNYYSGLLADLLLQPLPELSPGSARGAEFSLYEEILEPVKSGLSWSSKTRKTLHRTAIRNVLIDFAKDLSGESLERLNYFFYSLGFVDEEITLLKSNKWWVKAQAARNLGLLRARRGTPALVETLEDPNEDVKTQSMQSLVVLVGVEALRTIFQMVKDMSRWTTLELSVIVREFEGESIPYLVEALGYSDQSVVLFAIEMLAEIGFVEAVDPLLGMARDYPNIVIRSKAIEALGRLGDERSEPLLRELLRNPYPIIRSSALRALERIGSPGSIPQLKERVMSGEVGDRVSAARALAKSGKGGIDELHRFAEGSDSLIQSVAQYVIEESEGLQVKS